MKKFVNRGQVGEMITALRVSGLLKGKAQVSRRTVTIPLAVRRGVPPSEIIEAIEATHPELDVGIVDAIRDRAIVQDNGCVAVTIDCETTMAAIFHQASANSGVVAEFTRLESSAHPNSANG